MIAYTIVLLTDLEDVHSANAVTVQHGTVRITFPGELVRDFVRTTNHAYHDFPYQNCLEYGLVLFPPAMRPIFEYLYETLKEVFVWNKPMTFE